MMVTGGPNPNPNFPVGEIDRALTRIIEATGLQPRADLDWDRTRAVLHLSVAHEAARLKPDDHFAARIQHHTRQLAGLLENEDLTTAQLKSHYGFEAEPASTREAVAEGHSEPKDSDDGEGAVAPTAGTEEGLANVDGEGVAKDTVDPGPPSYDLLVAGLRVLEAAAKRMRREQLPHHSETDYRRWLLQLADIFEDIFDRKADQSEDKDDSNSGGPYVRFVTAVGTKYGIKVSPHTIREVLEERNRVSGRAQGEGTRRAAKPKRARKRKPSAPSVG